MYAARAATRSIEAERQAHSAETVALEEGLAIERRSVECMRRESKRQQTIPAEVTAEKLTSSQACRAAEARIRRIETVSIRYEGEIRNLTKRIAELFNCQHALRETQGKTERDMTDAHDTIRMVRLEIRRNQDTLTLHAGEQSRAYNARYSPTLPSFAATMTRVRELEGQNIRLEANNSIIIARVSEEFELRTGMVDSYRTVATTSARRQGLLGSSS